MLERSHCQRSACVITLDEQPIPVEQSVDDLGISKEDEEYVVGPYIVEEVISLPDVPLYNSIT